MPNDRPTNTPEARLHAVDWETDTTACGAHVDALPEGSDVKGIGKHPHHPSPAALPLCPTCWPHDANDKKARALADEATQ